MGALKNRCEKEFIQPIRYLARTFHPTSRSQFRSSLGSCIPRHLLTADSKHQHHINLRDVSIQRDVTARTAPDDQFPQLRPDRSTDQRISLQHIDGLDDVVQSSLRVYPFMLKCVFQDAIEIASNFRGELDA